MKETKIDIVIVYKGKVSVYIFWREILFLVTSCLVSFIVQTCNVYIASIGSRHLCASPVLTTINVDIEWSINCLCTLALANLIFGPKVVTLFYLLWKIKKKYKPTPFSILFSQFTYRWTEVSHKGSIFLRSLVQRFIDK